MRLDPRILNTEWILFIFINYKNKFFLNLFFYILFLLRKNTN